MLRHRHPHIAPDKAKRAMGSDGARGAVRSDPRTLSNSLEPMAGPPVFNGTRDRSTSSVDRPARLLQSESHTSQRSSKNAPTPHPIPPLIYPTPNPHDASIKQAQTWRAAWPWSGGRRARRRSCRWRASCGSSRRVTRLFACYAMMH